MGKNDNRVVLLTREKSCFGGMVLKEAHQQGLTINSVVCQEWRFKQKYKRFKTYARKSGLINVLFSKLSDAIDSFFQSIRIPEKSECIEEVAGQLNIPIITVPTLNGKKTIEILNGLLPDILLLGGIGIISEKIIQTASKGVLNSHPGKIPEYRGSYVVRWALLNHDPIVVTVHFVDTGIDTGNILSEEHILNIPKTKSLNKIEFFIEKQRAKLLIKSTQSFLKGDLYPRSHKIHSDNHLFSLLPIRKLIAVYGFLITGK